jgi:acetylglutamate kinase
VIQRLALACSGDLTSALMSRCTMSAACAAAKALAICTASSTSVNGNPFEVRLKIDTGIVGDIVKPNDIAVIQRGCRASLLQEMPLAFWIGDGVMGAGPL